MLAFTQGPWVLLLAALLGAGEAARAAGPPRPGASRSHGALPTPRFVCSAEELRGPPVMVHLTVSPLTKPRSREIEMNWRHTEEFTELGNDTVILSLGDPSSGSSRRLVSVEVSSHRGGRFRTKERFGHRELPHENMENRCTEYWIGYYRDERLLAKNCLKVLPAWMWQNREVLAPMSLDQMMIPGTHNSGTYKRSRDIVFKLVTTQDEDVWSQLVFGNRYLDMRVGFRPSERDPFWVYHDFFPVRPVNILIKHVRWFLEYTKEVVILHFHRFPVGFDNAMVHTQFVQYLTMELGQWMSPRVYDVTMGELWASDKRLIISYNDWPTRRQNEYLWPSIPQAWGDKKSVASLYGFLREEMRQRSGGPQWAAMAELTPSPWDIIIPNRGLRDLAQKANSEVTKWFRDEWWHTASVVATDFFLGNDMIDVAIEANIKRRKCVAGLVSHRGRRLRGRRGRRRAILEKDTPRSQHDNELAPRPAPQDRPAKKEGPEIREQGRDIPDVTDFGDHPDRSLQNVDVPTPPSRRKPQNARGFGHQLDMRPKNDRELVRRPRRVMQNHNVFENRRSWSPQDTKNTSPRLVWTPKLTEGPTRQKDSRLAKGPEPLDRPSDWRTRSAGDPGRQPQWKEEEAAARDQTVQSYEDGHDAFDLWTQESVFTPSLARKAPDPQLNVQTRLRNQQPTITNQRSSVNQLWRPTSTADWRTHQSRFTPRLPWWSNTNPGLGSSSMPNWRNQGELNLSGQFPWWTHQPFGIGQGLYSQWQGTGLGMSPSFGGGLGSGVGLGGGLGSGLGSSHPLVSPAGGRLV
ncbi:uncharacterized protein LOC122388258 isoform X1 [Amphibalanus amphitrite]|uniref:uncharacterized protein LOC122388258 isoform X1 n=1 Tax=Amphibalanus amphitrite TaxID=1232801 RepID=UPI001C9110D5|nr:uncharacterized protein LOC122388258 isoform X1 [Amphibalanus amphitrite]